MPIQGGNQILQYEPNVRTNKDQSTHITFLYSVSSEGVLGFGWIRLGIDVQIFFLREIAKGI